MAKGAKTGTAMQGCAGGACVFIMGIMFIIGIIVGAPGCAQGGGGPLGGGNGGTAG
jgi:hypothetical protein